MPRLTYVTHLILPFEFLKFIPSFGLNTVCFCCGRRAIVHRQPPQNASSSSFSFFSSTDGAGERPTAIPEIGFMGLRQVLQSVKGSSSSRRPLPRTFLAGLLQYRAIQTSGHKGCFGKPLTQIEVEERGFYSI